VAGGNVPLQIRLAAVCRFKFAVLIVGTLLDFRYRRIAMYAADLLFVMKFARH
jgi:hypothetical protein